MPNSVVIPYGIIIIIFGTLEILGLILVVGTLRRRSIRRRKNYYRQFTELDIALLILGAFLVFVSCPPLITALRVLVL